MARTLNRLTARQVATLKTPGWHADGGGLYLRIKPSGTRSWVLVDTRGGARKERGLGSADTVTLAEARIKRANPDTISPVGEPLFGAWAAQVIAGLEDGWKGGGSADQWKTTLATHAAALSKMRVSAITTDDVLAVLRPIWATINPTASRVRGRIEFVLSAAKAARHIADPWSNPARWEGHLEHFLSAPASTSAAVHHAAVPWKEMPAFWADLAARTPSVSVRALQLTILTAARRSETIGARVSEFDRTECVWIVPADRMKMGLEHSVPLSGAALAIVEEMALDRKPDDFLFPGTRGHLSEAAMFKLLRTTMGRRETVHGFRSSFRDWAGEATDFARELAEMALAHAVGGAAELAYRRGRALEKRRALMDAWASYLCGGA